MALARDKPGLETGSRRWLISRQIPRQSEPERSFRGRPIERDLKGLAPGHGHTILEQVFWYEITALA
jgi:hypothetical protein